MKSIAIYCGSSLGYDTKIQELAYELGKTLAQDGITVVYGAAKIGIMGQVAKGALENNGRVVGVIPEFLQIKEIVHTELHELYVTQTMAERKLKLIDLSEGFIALPGGFGTLEELFEVVTALQLGQIQKPVAVLNINGYYDNLFAMVDTMVTNGFLKQENADMIIVETTIESLLQKMKAFVPRSLPKWVK